MKLERREIALQIKIKLENLIKMGLNKRN